MHTSLGQTFAFRHSFTSAIIGLGDLTSGECVLLKGNEAMNHFLSKSLRDEKYFMEILRYI